MPVDVAASTDPQSSLLFQRLRAVGRLLGLAVVIDDRAVVLCPEAAGAEREPTWSMGQVKAPETVDAITGEPYPGGLFCPAIFGADLGRQGHVTLPSPVIPWPARPLLAALLGHDEADLAALAVEEPEALVAFVEQAHADGRRVDGWAPRQLLWWTVPVIAPALRAPSREEALRRDELGDRSAHALHHPYRRVVNRAYRLQRLRELAAPPLLLHNERRALAVSLDQLLADSERDEPDPLIDALTLFFAALTPELVAIGGWFARAASLADAEPGRRAAGLWRLAGERPREPLEPALLRLFALSGRAP